jgi:hypothetical protein
MKTTDKKERERQSGWRLIQTAYIRDGDTFHTGEAMSLACLLHTKGRGRDTKDMTDVQRIMKDRNLELKKDN